MPDDGPDLGPKERFALEEAAQALSQGKVIMAATDTLPGLIADAAQAPAVARIFEIKGRAQSSALPLLASDLEQVRQFADLNDTETGLANHFWPGPLTLVLKARSGKLPQVSVAEDGTIAVRVPAQRFCRALAGSLGSLLTATSVNLSGMPAAKNKADIPATVAEQTAGYFGPDVIVASEPSTIVRYDSGGLQILRAGAVTPTALHSFLGA